MKRFLVSTVTAFVTTLASPALAIEESMSVSPSLSMGWQSTSPLQSYSVAPQSEHGVAPSLAGSASLLAPVALVGGWAILSGAQWLGFPMLILTPAGAGLGQLVAGDPQRAAWVSLGGYGAVIGGFATGLAAGVAFGAATGRHWGTDGLTGAFLGMNIALAGYTIWASCDAWATAERIEQQKNVAAESQSQR